MKSILSFLAVLYMGISSLNAQLQPIFTLYREQSAVINPAIPSHNYIVSDFSSSISATYRYQWFNVPDAPTTQVLSWESMLDDRNLLVGAYAVNDKTGDIGFTNLYARCAYRLMFSEMDKRFLTIGMSVGASRFHTALAQHVNDPNIQIIDRSRVSPDLNFGVYYSHGKQFYVGLSAPQLLGLPHNFESLNDRQLRLKRPQHIYGVVGYFFDAPFMGNDVAYLEPNAWVRYIPATQTFGIDVGVRSKISQSFWAGTNYSFMANTLNVEIGTALGESIGLDSGELRIGMGFIVPLGSRWASLGSGGEILLSYAWSKQ